MFWLGIVLTVATRAKSQPYDLLDLRNTCVIPTRCAEQIMVHQQELDRIEREAREARIRAYARELAELDIQYWGDRESIQDGRILILAQSVMRWRSGRQQKEYGHLGEFYFPPEHPAFSQLPRKTHGYLRLVPLEQSVCHVSTAKHWRDEVTCWLWVEFS